jgi:catechol 2,3-dioxygenase-like lactoylglutathione lyase family enzyme
MIKSIEEDLPMTQAPGTGAVHHLTLTVRDIRRSTEFYTKHFGFQEVVEFDSRILLANGGMLLALTPPPDPARAIPGDAFNENRIGLDHASFAVDDLQALQDAAAYFDEQGIAHGEIRDLGQGFAIFVMAVRDPDNIQLELTAPYAA